MALMRIRAAVPPLAAAARICAALPDPLPLGEERLPVLWLLGDEGRSADDYLRRIPVESWAQKHRMIIVMPEGLHSDYEDMKRGLDWYSYVSQGLPGYLTSILPLSCRKEENFIFGMGMGGLGAVRLGLRKPDFAGAAGGVEFDACPFAQDEAHSDPAYIHRMQTIYGDDFRAPQILEESDLFRLCHGAEALPRIMLYCDPRSPYRGSLQDLTQALQSKRPDCGLSVLPSMDLLREALSDFLTRCLK